MTSKTGSTPMRDLPTGPPFVVTIIGPIIQLGVLAYVWHGFTTARDCLFSPLHCLLHPFTSDPWGRTVIFTIAFALFMWALSLRSIPSTGTSDPSIVDRLWSIMPWLYMWHWCLSSMSLRLFLMTVLSTIWGVRLTYNFWIKGGFSGGEDYRWAVVRKWYTGWQWEAFNLLFICLFQQCAVLGFVVPAVPVMQSSRPLGSLDLIASILYLALVIGEAIADHQMFEYQTEKYRRKAANEDLGPYSGGFIDTGLWAYSRHPNYFCEVTMWWVFYLFSVAATNEWINWTILGPVFLSCLFIMPGASLDLTEALSSSKYPHFAEYQSRVSKFVPWLPRKATTKAE